MKNLAITLSFCITNLIFTFFWIIYFFIINSATDLLQYFNYIKYINLCFTLVFVIICLVVFKLDFDKLFSRFPDGEKLPTLDKTIFMIGVELLTAILIIGFLYTVFLNLTDQKISQTNLLRLFDIPFLILINYVAFIIEYLSFRYYLHIKTQKKTGDGSVS